MPWPVVTPCPHSMPYLYGSEIYVVLLRSRSRLLLLENLPQPIIGYSNQCRLGVSMCSFIVHHFSKFYFNCSKMDLTAVQISYDRKWIKMKKACGYMKIKRWKPLTLERVLRYLVWITIIIFIFNLLDLWG